VTRQEKKNRERKNTPNVSLGSKDWLNVAFRTSGNLLTPDQVLNVKCPDLMAFLKTVLNEGDQRMDMKVSPAPSKGDLEEMYRIFKRDFLSTMNFKRVQFFKHHFADVDEAKLALSF